MERWIRTLSTLSHCREIGALERKRDLLTRDRILYLKKGPDRRKSEVESEEYLRVKHLLRKAD